MTADAKTVIALTRGIRACFNRLRALGDALHEDLGVPYYYVEWRAALQALGWAE